MAIKDVHPLYSKMVDYWNLARHSFAGEKTIKEQGTTYLPATPGQVLDGQGKGATQSGEISYQAYKLRAVYPSIYSDAVEAAVGILHREPPKIDLPDTLDNMLENATLLGESLEQVLRNIHTQQLVSGRLGLLGDIRKNKEGKMQPVIAIYNDLTIRNWDDVALDDEAWRLRVAILDETQYTMDDSLQWEEVTKYRVLALVKPGEGDGLTIISDDGTGVYASALVGEDDELINAEFKVPSLMGTELEEIPFVFVNSNDLSPSPDLPPLDGLARLCLTIYRGEADYRQNLFMQGQDTLVCIGRLGADSDEEDVRTGAGARIDIRQGGDAKYIGVSSQGLPEQREALKNDYDRAVQKSGQLLDATSRAKESGDALRIRVAAQTATLPQIAKTGAAALEQVLKMLARWYGADEDQVSVTPNLNFTEADLNGKTLVEMMQAKGLGAPLSEESVHEWMQKEGMTELTYEAELERLAQEEPLPGAGILSPVDEDDDDEA
jgi:hypothetical protein